MLLVNIGVFRIFLPAVSVCSSISPLTADSSCAGNLMIWREKIQDAMALKLQYEMFLLLNSAFIPHGTVYVSPNPKQPFSRTG